MSVFVLELRNKKLIRKKQNKNLFLKKSKTVDMSIIDIPLTNTYYNPHVSLTRDYVSPIKETAQFRNLESP